MVKNEIIAKLNDDSLATLRSAYGHWLYERDVTRYLEKKRDFIFIDVGAALGFYEWKMKPYAREMHAFEPDPVRYPLLVKNVRGISSVRTYQIALSNVNGVCDFYTDFTNLSGSLKGEHPEKKFKSPPIKIATRTLDSLFDKVDIVKIDSEGSELEVLQGAVKLIEKCHPEFIIECHPPHSTDEMMVEFFKQYDYKSRCLGHLLFKKE